MASVQEAHNEMKIKNLKRPYDFQIKQQKNIVPYIRTMMIFFLSVK